MIGTGSLEELRIDRSIEEAPSPGRRLGPASLVVVLLFGLGVAAWWWTGSAAPQVRTAAVSTIGAGEASVLDASGYVTPRRRATVSSKVTGKVAEVLIEEGMRVEQGAVLARLDAVTAEQDVALGKAELVAARTALAETEVRLAQARRDLARARALEDEGLASQSTLDAAQAEVDALAARLAVGRDNVRVLERQLALRQQLIEDMIIRAPFAGVVVTKDAQPGEMISPISAGGGYTRTGICTIVDMESLEIEVDVSETYISRVRPGQRVQASLLAYPDWSIPSRVITAVPTADRQKATVRVRIAFDELDPRILPDMGVKVRFLEEAPAAAAGGTLAVPLAAVRREDGEAVAYVVDGELLRRRVLALGRERDGLVAVASGLRAGEAVVIEGPAELAEAMAVRVRR